MVIEGEYPVEGTEMLLIVFADVLSRRSEETHPDEFVF
jgi:hypothetical protein